MSASTSVDADVRLRLSCWPAAAAAVLINESRCHGDVIKMVPGQHRTTQRRKPPVIQSPWSHGVWSELQRNTNALRCSYSIAPLGRRRRRFVKEIIASRMWRTGSRTLTTAVAYNKHVTAHCNACWPAAECESVGSGGRKPFSCDGRATVAPDRQTYLVAARRLVMLANITALRVICQNVAASGRRRPTTAIYIQQQSKWRTA